MSKHQETIERELDRIAVGLRSPITDDRYTNLYAAQQALSWALFPSECMSPYEAVINGKVQPIIPDTHEDSEDCSAALRHLCLKILVAVPAGRDNNPNRGASDADIEIIRARLNIADCHLLRLRHRVKSRLTATDLRDALMRVSAVRLVNAGNLKIGHCSLSSFREQAAFDRFAGISMRTALSTYMSRAPCRVYTRPLAGHTARLFVLWLYLSTIFCLCCRILKPGSWSVLFFVWLLGITGGITYVDIGWPITASSQLEVGGDE